jgi:hypothetical protein
MKIARPPKKYIILAAISLVAAALAAVSGGRQVPAAAVIEPAGKDASKPIARAEQSNAQGAIRLEKLNRPVVEADAVNLFATKSWYVPPPPPPPPKPAPPPPPSAPALPFTYMGKLEESPGHLVVFLVKGDRVYTVSAGDVLDGIYHIDEIAGDRLGLTYLPLKIKQSLNIGGTS